MKKLLIVLLAAMMVLSLAAVSMAAPTVGGELKFIYKIADELVDDNNDENDITDATEAKVTFTTEVSDTVKGFVAIKAKEGAAVSAYLDEYHMTFTQGFGTVKVGYFGHKLTPSLDIIKGHGLKELKANALTVVDYNVSDAFVVGLAYALDGNEKKLADADADAKLALGDFKPVYDGAYDLKLGYKADSFGGEVHIFGNGDVEVAGKVESVTALDIWYQPTDVIKAYFDYVAPSYKDETAATEKDPAMIVGALFTLTEALSARVEYNLEAPEGADNNYGVKFVYKFTNKVTGELKMEGKEDGTSPMEVSFKVAL